MKIMKEKNRLFKRLTKCQSDANKKMSNPLWHVVEEKKRFRAILKDKDMVKFFSILKWIFVSNPRIRDILIKFREEFDDISILASLIIRLNSFHYISNELKGEMVSKQFPWLLDAYKKFINFKK